MTKIDDKLVTFKALMYVKDLLTPHVPGRSLRSMDGALLVVLRSRLVTKGDQAFAVRDPRF